MATRAKGKKNNVPEALKAFDCVDLQPNVIVRNIASDLQIFNNPQLKLSRANIGHVGMR